MTAAIPSPPQVSDTTAHPDQANGAPAASQLASGFVHLRLHSEFSVADGMVRLDDAVKAAAADGQGALALTDLANLFGQIKFYKEARGKGVKPIIGCDAWISTGDDRQHPSYQPARLLLLVKNKQGYLNLCELLSKAWLVNQIGRASCRERV